MRRISFVVVMLLITFSSFAQEVTSSYEFLGFSDDLKYAAIETHIPPPVEESAPFSKIIFVDIEKNSWPTKPLSFTGKSQQSTESAIATNKKLATPLFAKYKLTPGKILGEQIPLKMTKSNFGRDIPSDTQVFVIDNVRYTLLLNVIETGETHESLMIPKYKFELLVKYNGKTQILQKDNTVPASRGFTIGYNILSVHHSGQRLVVVMELSNPGFEGYPDTYNMVVSGVLGK